MQITGVDQYHLEHQAEGSFEPTWIPGYPQGTHEVELFAIRTDTGHTGYGAMPSFAGGMDFSDPLSYFLLGEDPHDVEGVLRKLDSINLVGPRPWGVEIAMWDLIGKNAGKPVYELLGGSTSEIPVYASTGELLPAEERIDYVADVTEAGVDAVKLRVTEPDHIDIVRAVRDAYPDLPLMVDANKGWAVRVVEDERQWSFREALEFARGLEDVGGVRWLEEPLPRHDYEQYARLRDAVDVPIAGGEFNDGIHHFREFVKQGSLDVLQPDAALATGIKRADEVAAMARQHGLEYVPHTWTNGVGFVANLHVMAANDSPWCEFPMEPPWTPDVRDFLLEETVDHEDGVVTPPEGPGLGVEIDESLLTG
ncbi:mandelate racemase/muconate lactonizing enzyme family protein [Halorientalis sp.]|jgi:L-alanine-DL-glutamate epimerase-like enolase superfamily enzyme|uniref:mandelate racemase/muconate lactonizing enzyme family protein n=1 Tax=Halorientalis sp. TaxID=1931229 RepID=UPI002615ABC4|nr:mandelate racemase/muconate lactonizing enzyme family protein [Halorientalis sp.]